MRGFGLDWLGRRARLSPDAVALVFEGRATRYAAWNARVNRTARALARRGVGAGDVVAVLAANHPTWLDVWFACGKLGAVLQALNWRLPQASLATLVDRAKPKLGLHDDAHAQVELPVGRRLSFDELEAERVEEAESDPDVAPPPLEAPWVLCFTGGTTGLPKAAILTHGNVLWNAMGTAASWGLHPRAKALLNAPLFHTGGMNVLTAPLVWVGGTSVLSRGFDVDETFDAVESGVTHFFGVPTMFQRLQASPRFDTFDASGLELVISGGAPCPAPVFERFFARELPFKTGYGLTEAGPNNFWLPDAQVQRKVGSVGYPLLHVEARRVDEAGRVLTAPGEVGELHLRGPHVTPGYHGQPEATAAALDPDGWLRTGDLCLADEDGCYRIVGRKKEMFISGGENVYPAEVESVLHGHPDVVEAAVVGVPDPQWGEVGRAYLVSGRPLERGELSTWLRARLAGFQCPKTMVFLDELPKTGAGKVDKRRLVQDYPASDPSASDG